MSEWKGPDKLPRHVAIIMDGNGRWAARRGLPRALGHRKGVEALRAVVRESSDLGIEVLTLFAFSTENWKRTAEEVGVLMGLLLEFFSKELDALHANNVRIRILGELAGLPNAQRRSCTEAMERTRDNGGMQLNIALNYGGRDEMVRAVRKLITQGVSADAIDEQTLANALDTAGQPYVDFLIRPSGEQRLSNFLLFQAAYAEYYFTDVLWPDFGLDAYHDALTEYAARDRRFGGRNEHKGALPNA